MPNLKTLFNSEIQKEVLERINSLSRDSKALWGNMNVYQMVVHCIRAERHYQGQLPIAAPQGINLADGPKWLHLLLADDTPMMRGARTNKAFVVEEAYGDLEAEILTWESLIAKYKTFRAPKYVHWFFGEMTREQLGQLAYKHNDHHLRQFGV